MAAKRSHAFAPWWTSTKPTSPAGPPFAETTSPRAKEATKPNSDAQRKIRESQGRTGHLPTAERLLLWAGKIGLTIRQDLESGKRKFFIPMRPEDFAALKIIARDDPDQRIGISSYANTSSDSEGPIIEATLTIDPKLFQNK